MNTLTDCQNKLNYQYNNLQLLKRAFTHRSFLNENRKLRKSNERLEFLGDAVLELVTSEFLFHKFPNTPEGQLTSLRAKIVQTKTLAAVAQSLELGSHIQMSKGEKAGGGQNNISILADLVEAIIGSIYLDGGYQKAQKFISDNLLKKYQIIIKQAEVEDYKSQLQESVQAKGGLAPIYKVIKEAGPDHNKIFEIEVVFFDKSQAKGIGKSKQSAQQEAARKALEKINK